MAQEQYGFFNSTVEDERSYDSADMAVMLRTLAASGVADGGECLRISAEGSTMRTLVGYGSAMVEGHYYRLGSDGGSVKAFEHGTEAELGRIDRIILRLNLTARTVTLQKLIGTAASTPQAPALTRNAEVWELSLAQVRIRAGASEVLPADITDERGDEAVCGLIAPDSLKRSVLEAMIGERIAQAAAEIQADSSDVLRYSAQPLLAAQQTQARTNLGAQAAISASGLLKGNGSGGVSAAAEGVDYAGMAGGKVLPSRISATVEVRTEGWTLAMADAGKFFYVYNQTPVNIVIPNDAAVDFADGTEIEFWRGGSGDITFQPAQSVVVVSVDSMRSIAQTHGVVSVKKIWENLWLLIGNLK
ncbi:MAG TPA: hypothetical protein PKU80_02880 [Candidatus Limiplasma sp.]|nr:hypothetical protein [Candidatus Limiplasma sp.]HRX07702.1 hypothetical protein [Candidatus Limiplasma sp.]